MVQLNFYTSIMYMYEIVDKLIYNYASAVLNVV